VQLDPNIEEDQVHSCRTIAYFLSKYNGNDDESQKVRKILQKDLCWRVSALSVIDRAIIMAEAWYNLLPGDIKQVFSPDALRIGEFDTLMRMKKDYRDVSIVTVIECELRAVLTALGSGTPDREDMRIGDFRYWFGEIPRYGSKPLSVVVTLVGERRNVPCAIAVEQLLSNFDTKLLVLVGIAAGPKEKVKLGDVVCAKKVYDYEHVRLEVQRFFGLLLKIARPRPQYIDVEKEIETDIEIYDDKRMKTYFRELVGKTDQQEIRVISDNFEPSFHTGTIAAGEKLFADGSLSRMFKKVDQEIRAGDQEDSGFAQVAKIKKLKWCIFRGICDYGDPKKGDAWHFAAALSAASAAMTFLKSAWKDER